MCKIILYEKRKMSTINSNTLQGYPIALQPSKSGNGNSRSPLIELRRVVKVYKTAAGDYPALKGISLKVYPGEFLGIIGKSGAGTGSPSCQPTEFPLRSQTSTCFTRGMPPETRYGPSFVTWIRAFPIFPLFGIIIPRENAES